MDLIMTGISASERTRRENLLAATRNLVMEKLVTGGPSSRTIEVNAHELNFSNFYNEGGLFARKIKSDWVSIMLMSQLLEELKKQSSMEVHLSDVSC